MKEEPLVMCVTNTVAADITANVLLAMGAKPAMVEEPFEAAELALGADAVLINLGTVNSSQLEVMRAAIAACEMKRVPWVLDPVACQQLRYRREIAIEFATRHHPSLIRGNHGEIDFLRDRLGGSSLTMLSTGATDRLYVDGKLVESFDGGVEMLTKVTATGCSQGAICAAYLGLGYAPSQAAKSASRLMKRAGEMAWEHAQKPGAFRAALIDALWELCHD